MLDSGSVQIVGQIVPDYELLRRIGGGAYGEVWLARSKATGVLRAAKIVWRRTFDDERPFQREFEGIQRFERISREHPSQLSLFHIGRNDAEGCFYYVMELADNVGTDADYVPRTLRADLANGRLPAARVLEIGLALTEALGHLHQSGLVHRDVKPSNVIFVNGRPKLADIGLVTDASDTRSIVGTEGYLAPEGPGTPQADIFALGKVLYEAATGLDRRSFPDLPAQLKDWPDAKDVREINEVILRSCAPAIARRYTACDQVQGDLELIQSGQSVRQKRARQQYRATGKKIGLALGVLAVVAGLAIIWPRQFRRSAPSSDGPDSTNIEANGLCDKAMYILRGDNYSELGAAYSNFNAAIALDPNFARPYVGLLELRSREDVNISGVPPAETREDMRVIAQSLQRLAPHLAATHCAECVLSCQEFNFVDADEQTLEAINADPNYELAHTSRAWLLQCTGRPDDARKELEISRRIAPSKTIVYRALGEVEFAERHYAKAIDWLKMAIQWEPHHWMPYRLTGRALQAQGDYTHAFDYLEKADVLAGADEAETRKAYAYERGLLARQGITGYWQDQWLGSMKYPDRDFYYKATIQIHLGNTNAALVWLQKACDTRGSWPYSETPLNFLLFDEYWDGLRDNPRFIKLLETLGYTKVMPHHQISGWSANSM